MRYDYEEEDSDQPSENDGAYCEDCRVLTDALQDMEQQCREAEDEGVKAHNFSRCADQEAAIRGEEIYLAKILKLQRRRDSALEVLLKHQRLEHQ